MSYQTSYLPLPIEIFFSLIKNDHDVRLLPFGWLDMPNRNDKIPNN